jgi:hypothetical protein
MLHENAFGTVPLHELKKPLIIDSPDCESYARMRRHINDSAVWIPRSQIESRPPKLFSKITVMIAAPAEAPVDD